VLDKVIRVCNTSWTGSARQLPDDATKGPTMSQTVFSERVAARPIRALIIQPDNSYEVREIDQDIQTRQGLLGGDIKAPLVERRGQAARFARFNRSMRLYSSITSSWTGSTSRAAASSPAWPTRTASVRLEETSGGPNSAGA
jgi:hypothetical protein